MSLAQRKTVSKTQSLPLSTRSRLRRWALRRARQISIAVLIVAVVVGVAACAIMIRRATGLIGLPDIGDPFDVAAFRAFRVPEDQDAVILVRQAAAKVKPMPDLPRSVKRRGPAVDWSQADPKLRDWVMKNREPLELFRRASERPDGIANPARELRDDTTYLDMDSLIWLALLEGARLEELGDMPGAWGWYQTVFRMNFLLMRRGSILQRFYTYSFGNELHTRVAHWAADPKTDVTLLRKALEAVKGGEPKPDWYVFSLKLDYVIMMHELDRPDGLIQQGSDANVSLPFDTVQLPPDIKNSIYNARRFTINEPERSRRVLRLAFANWLAHLNEPETSNRMPAVRAKFQSPGLDTSVFFYALAPDAPAGARRLSPQNLAKWLLTAPDAQQLLLQWPWPSIRLSEQREFRGLVVAVAAELYRRERGSLPPNDEALVGTYLDSLPGDGADELDDGRVPVISESPASGRDRPN
jgi:hypothetical protein